MKRKFQPTDEQKAKAAERRAAFRDLCNKIDAMTDDERRAFAEKMPVIATVDGRALSGKNSMLVSHQCEGATIVGGFKQWHSAGRKVAKGERGISIWIPRLSGEEADSPDGFVMGYVWDISQTEPIEEAANEAQVQP